MKFRYLKSLIPAALSLSLTFGMVSCVGDLDISPIDPQVSGNFSQDEVFTKLYASLVLTGQQGPSEAGYCFGRRGEYGFLSCDVHR